MHFTITKENFLEGLSSTLQIIPSKSTLPILTQIMIQAEENGKVTFSGSNLNIGIRVSAAAEVHETGVLTAPAKRLYEIIRALPNEPIDFHTSGAQIRLQCHRGFYQMIGIEADEFPSFPDASKQKKITVDAEQFSYLIGKTSYAVSTDEMRPMLNGVFWELYADGMVMVATDGHRLAKLRHQLAPEEIIVENTENEQDVEDEKSEAEGSKIGVIVPPKALSLVHRLLRKHGEITVYFDENFILFTGDEDMIFSRLIEGDYVNYDQVIPYQNDKEVRTNRMDLLKAVRRVAILADELSHQIIFRVKPELVELSVNNPEKGEAREEIAAEYKGEELAFGYNAQYLIDILTHFDSDNVLFKLGDSIAAGLILPDPPQEDYDFLTLIMPIRLED